MGYDNLGIRPEMDPRIKARIEQDKKKYRKTDELIKEGKLGEVHKQHPDINPKLLEYINNLPAGVKEDYLGNVKNVPAPWDYVLGGVAAKKLVGTAIGTYGLDKTLEVGINALFPDAPDTLLEQFMRNKQMGLGATAIKGARLTKDTLQNTLDSVFDLRIPNPFEVPTLFETGQGMGPRSGDVVHKSPKGEWVDPRTKWETSEGLAEAKMRKDQFEDAILTDQGTDTNNPLVYKPEEPVSPKGVPISKQKISGYKFQGIFAKEWNAWSKSKGFLDELADKTGTAFVEHLVGKGDRLNWFWRLPDSVRSWRPGTRHSPNNVRLFYSNRQKSLKDAVENLFYPMQQNLPDMDRWLVDYDLPPVKPGESITVRKPSGDIVLRRVDGTIVGRIGDYHDVLYAPQEDLAKALTTNINPRTGTFYIDPNTKDMKRAIQKWREKIILEKINNIMEEAPSFKDKSPGDTFQQQAGKIIDEELAAFLKEYDFIPKPKGSTIDATIAATSFEGPPPNIKKLLGNNVTPEMKTFFTDNPDGMDMLIDRLNGMNWRQLKRKYKGYNRGTLEQIKNQLTSSQVQRIMNAYGWSGKGGLGKTKFRPPFKGYTKTLEQKTTKIKGTSRVNYDDIINEAFDD
tara:strand:- start:74 stop:1951 length:1878 start_codon:yes stop_codon:yes gene_type:complete